MRIGAVEHGVDHVDGWLDLEKFFELAGVSKELERSMLLERFLLSLDGLHRPPNDQFRQRILQVANLGDVIQFSWTHGLSRAAAPT